MKDVQCYDLFGGIALKNHAFYIDNILSMVYLPIVSDIIWQQNDRL